MQEITSTSLTAFESGGTICSGIGLNYSVTPNNSLPSFGYDLYMFKRHSGNSGRTDVSCNVGALKHPILRSPDQATERELRRGIERWENEGGRLLPRVKRDSETDKGFSRSTFLRAKRPEA